MQNKKRKNDLILIISIIIITACVFLIMNLFSKSGDRVLVEQNSAQIAVLDLNKDCVYNVYNDNGDICNTVQIKNGKVKMIYADCKDKICKNHKEISKSNESIICLPNKVEITVISDKSENVDGVAK